MSLAELLVRAVDARAAWLEDLALDPHGETTGYRLFHGAVEGRPGLTVDRYGPVLLVQSFREALSRDDLAAVEALGEQLGLHLVWNHRGREPAEPPLPSPDALARTEVQEHGLRFAFQARHRGRDPWLFLDFRAGRRAIRASGAATVLNLFAYTCGASVAALAGGAVEVWSVDFAGSALDVGEDNIASNAPPGSHVRVQADVIPTLRQLAGLPVKGRGARRGYPRFEARAFDLVILDPPTFSTGPFGAVDLVRDYQSLFKPAILATAPGGAVLATNHVSTVDLDDWLEALRRCAAKAGRPLEGIEVIPPDPDFPSPDGRHPLKMAWCEVP